MNNKKKVATGLIVASIASVNITPIKALLNDEFISEISNKSIIKDKNDKTVIKSVKITNSNLKDENSIHVSKNDDIIKEIKDTALLNSLNLKLNKNEVESKNKRESLSLDLAKIETLDISGQGIKDLSGIENLINLKHLNISNNEISDISSLAKLPKLEKVVASNNNITDITMLKDTSLIEADFTNQKITLNNLSLSTDSFEIKNPIMNSDDIKINYIIPSKGILENKLFKWTDYNFDIDKIIIPFTTDTNCKVLYSGVIIQNILIDTSILNIDDIVIDLGESNAINSDLDVNYIIPEKYRALIDSVELPNGEVLSTLSGSFKASENGLYNMKVHLKNNTFIEKTIKVFNIDKEKPSIKVLDKSTENDIITLNLEAVDLETGIDYVLLPNGDKVYENKVSYSSRIKDCIEFKVFDKAGNYEELLIYPENREGQPPEIIASNTQVYLGEDFNPLSHIRAVDFNGNDISKNTSIVFNNFDNTSLGEYTISYKVKDNKGYETVKDVIVEVIDKPKTLNTTNIMSSNNSNEIKKSLQYQPTSVIESNAYNKTSVSSSDISNLNKSIYSSGILLSMVAGFGFLFKSGKDDF